MPTVVFVLVVAKVKSNFLKSTIFSVGEKSIVQTSKYPSIVGYDKEDLDASALESFALTAIIRMDITNIVRINPTKGCYLSFPKYSASIMI